MRIRRAKGFFSSIFLDHEHMCSKDVRFVFPSKWFQIKSILKEGALTVGK